MKQNIEIMIVDDETLVAADLEHTLRNLGYAISHVVRSGEEALAALSEYQPQLILMDIVLQGELSGIETAQRIQQKYDIPLVYLTAHTDERTLNEAKVTGPYGYLVKPFESTELKTTIELALYKHGAEKELRESEAWFSTTFRSIGDGVIVTNEKGEITFLNPHASMLVGLGEAHLIGRALDETVHIVDERSKAPITRLVQKTLDHGEATELIDSTLLKTHDGREIPIDISASPVKDSEGILTGMVLVFHDTLDRKLTEEALRESEERYRSIFEESRDAIFIVTRKGYFVVANQSLLTLFDYTRDEVIERHITDLFDEPDAWKQFQSAIEKQVSLRDFPVAMKNSKGVSLECLLSASVRKNSENRIMGYQGIIRDMTEKNLAERALRTSEQRYRLLAENVTDIIWTLDNELNLTFVSPSASAILGYETAALLEMQLHDLCETSAYEAMINHFPYLFSASLNEQVEGAGNKTLEVELNKADGSKLWVDMSFTSLKNEENVKVGILGVVRDIGKRKSAEMEKDRLHVQLLQAQKMEAVGLLAGGVAHDFNNLLTVIQGNTDLAMMNLEKDDMLYADLQEIHKASQRAAELTSQLLLFSRKQPMRLVSLNVNQVIDDLLKMLHRLIGEDVGIVTDLEDELSPIQADRGSMEQVVMNLAVNARDAMPQGGQFIIRSANLVLDEEAVRHMPEAREGQFIRLSLIDHGVGMAPGTLERIFEPFFSTKGRGRGTGLGLSVVYGIVKQHQGWIDVQSREGEGTQFHIYIPADLEQREILENRIDTVTDVNGHGERIMVIEDESGVRHLTTKALSEHGYVVVSAKCAEEARQVYDAERHRLDAVVSDVVLPDGTGVELVGEFLTDRPGLPILLCSGYTDKKSQWETIQQKGYPFLQKPFNISDLLKHVHLILKNKTPSKA